MSVILLHGALGDAADLAPLHEALALRGINSIPFTFSGHGGTPFGAGFSIPAFSDELVAFIYSNAPLGVHVFGYSMGGYVALCTASKHPSLVKGVVTLATKMDWSADVVARETAWMNESTVTEKMPEFASSLQRRHGPQWTLLLENTTKLISDIHRNDYLGAGVLSSVRCPAIMCVGDGDKMVTAEETSRAAAQANGKFRSLAGTRHAIATANSDALAEIIATSVANTV
jgi:pimeloyl-ACP methyl ester carboxylesterase